MIFLVYKYRKRSNQSRLYAAAKAGVIGFSKSLAREVASRGITVNVVRYILHYIVRKKQI